MELLFSIMLIIILLPVIILSLLILLWPITTIAGILFLVLYTTKDKKITPEKNEE